MDQVRPLRERLIDVGAELVASEGTVPTVAQPSLSHDLGASVARVQWTSTAYLLAVAAFLVLAGRSRRP